jgi:4-carboxymuconolactone decarboxylase
MNTRFALIAAVIVVAAVAPIGEQQIVGQGRGSGRAVPADIDLASGSRLPLVVRDSLDDFGRSVYDDIVVGLKEGRLLAGLRGPSGILLYSPPVSDLFQKQSRYLSSDEALGRRLSELSILVTARELNSQFEWTAHEPAAIAAGVDRRIVDIIKYRKRLEELSASDRLVIQMGRELFGKRRVTSETFAAFVNAVGRPKAVQVLAQMTRYAGTAFLLIAVDQQLAADQPPLLPVP